MNIEVGISYEEMEKFVLDHISNDYNVKKCLSDFVGDMGESGAERDIFKMNDLGEEFVVEKICDVIDEENEEYEYTYNVEYTNRYEGVKWSQVPEKIKEELITNEVYSGIDSSKVKEGEGILDLENGLKIECVIDDGEITINDNSVMYL